MGQKRPVQIVNFVAKGTIEEGMLSVLAFKRSLSAGILDGGTGEISLGGSRLSRFMKDVENVTGKMGEGEAMTPAEEVPTTETATPEAGTVDAPVPDQPPVEKVGAGETAPEPALAPVAASGAASDPWSALIDLGSQLVSALTSTDASHPWVERDPASGVRSLKVPLPPPETAARIADALTALAQAMRVPR
jgi:hypothetical protein